MFDGSSFNTDNNEQNIQRSILEQAAPLSKGTKRKASDSGSSTSSEEDKKPKASKKRKDGNPHRKPKNFAERLMRVLQDGIGQDTIWWVGDGKAIGIHSRNLRRGDMLSEHFSVKDYSVFIRNCNRWGFRRTVQYKVPQGVITYECSLFQRDKPHLVHHMRMDSDVQDVFLKHKDIEGDIPFDPKRIAKAAKTTASASPKAPQKPVAQASTNNDEAPAAVRVPPPLQPAPHQGLASLQGIVNDPSQLLQVPGNNTGMWRADPPAATASNPNFAGSTTTTETALLDRILSGNVLHQQPRAAARPAPDPMLQRILSLSQEYMDAEDKSAQTANDPIRMALHILKLQGEKFEQERELQAQLAARDPLSALRNQLLAATNNAASSSSQAANNNARQVVQAEHLFQTANLARLGSLQGSLVRGGLNSLSQQARLSERSVVVPEDVLQLLNRAVLHAPPQRPQGVPDTSQSEESSTMTTIFDLLQSQQKKGR